MTTHKTIHLCSGDRSLRKANTEAHDAGRHGDGTKADVLAHWASFCADCNAIWRYEFATATRIA